MISHTSPSGEWTTNGAPFPVANGSQPAESHNCVSRAPFEAASELAWGELVRDVTAVANIGGGGLVLPLKVNGCADRERIVAGILERLARCTDPLFDDVRASESAATEPDVLNLIVGPAEFPIGFKRSFGDVSSSDTSQTTQPFVAGAFYFWHAGKSELATSRDFQAFIECRLDEVRRRWSKEIDRVLSRPLKAIRKQRRGRRPSRQSRGMSTNLQPVRIVNDANAPVLQPQHVDQLYPWRQKEIVAELNRRIGRPVITTYDLQAVRRQHRLDERPEFVFHLPGAGRRYSPAAVDWMLAQYAHEPVFFTRAHVADQAMLRQRRQKPR
jgi:hypothetical protein